MSLTSTERTRKIERELEGLRNKLRNHALYSNLTNLKQVQAFMENHVFAVWYFMSVVKYLQNTFTRTEAPWLPPQNNAVARFINEMVLDEETDINEKGEVKSHFEMYLEAMEEIGANTEQMTAFIKRISDGHSISYALNQGNIIQTTAEFTQFTFDLIDSNKPHIVASAFTFGREDIIPDMFIEILEQADKENVKYAKLRYYLQRHIELDGDEHGPLALKMIAELCGNDDQKWSEVLLIAKKALEKRIKLWDGINACIVGKERLASD